MNKYLLSEEANIENDFLFVFICGSKYKEHSKEDKRNVIYNYLKTLKGNNCIRPIILEKNFIFGKDSKKYLLYDDIYLGNLYQVESLVNELADRTIIIHESISTGAEAGLFLGNKSSWSKTCLLVPDEIATEEDKLGSFLKLALRRMEPPIRIFRFYPTVKKYYLSNQLNVWHTSFKDNRIGDNLSAFLKEFLDNEREQPIFRFTSVKNQAKDDGSIHYSIKNKTLNIDILPRTLLVAICCLFSVKEYCDQWVGEDNKWSEISSIIKEIKNALEDVFINTIEEITGKQVDNCIIRPRISVNDISINNIIGMCLYLLKAADLIEIFKAKDGIWISRHILGTANGHVEYFYSRYEKGIQPRIENKII